MARGPFDQTNNMSTTTAITAYPLTVSMWIRTPDRSTSDIAFSLTETTGDWLSITQIAGGAIRVTTVDFTVNQGSATTTNIVSNDTWHHVCGVWLSASSRTAFIDGGDKTTDTTNVSANIAGMDELEIGHFRNSAANDGLDIAEVGIWNVALSDEEVATLGKGFSCHLIRPQSLVHHMPLIRSSIDLRGDITESGTVPVVPHPPIIGAIAT